jgi:hypothetical protein
MIARWAAGGWSRRAEARGSERDCEPEGHLETGRRGSASGTGALIEVEVRNRLRFGQVVHRRLIEVEIGIGVEGEFRPGQSAGGSERRRAGGQTEVGEDGIDGLGGGDEGEDAHVGAAVEAGEGEDLVDAGEEAGPAGAGGGAVRRVCQVGGADPGGSCCGSQDGAAVGVARRHDSVAVEVDGRSRRRALGARTP